MNLRIRRILTRLRAVEVAAMAITVAAGLAIAAACALDTLTGHQSRLFIPTIISATCLGTLALPVWAMCLIARLVEESR